MTDTIDSQAVDGSRLKQLNLELGKLAKEHRTCRVNSFAFTAIAAVVLVISFLGLVQLIPAGANDWAQNPDSPVYAIAVEQGHATVVKGVIVAFGFFAGIGLLYRVRTHCSRQRHLWNREVGLRNEMRQIRDRLYIADRPLPANDPRPHRPAGHTSPLEPDDARGEYVGLYNPPASQGATD